MIKKAKQTLILQLLINLILLTSFAQAAEQKTSKTIKLDTIELSINYPEKPLQNISKDDLYTWAQQSTKAVEEYYQQFPVKKAHLVINFQKGEGIEGVAYPGEEPVIVIVIGDKTSRNDLKDDWVLVHEMVHLGHPRIYFVQHWLEEGLATYLERVIRTRAKLTTEQESWEWLINGFNHVISKKGLDRTQSWANTYWGGALFVFLVDLEIRKQSNGKYSIRDALKKTITQKGTMQYKEVWKAKRFFELADQATGTSAFMDTYTLLKEKPNNFDNKHFWKSLGISVKGKKIKLHYDIDDKNSTAVQYRIAIITGNTLNKILK